MLAFQIWYLFLTTTAWSSGDPLSLLIASSVIKSASTLSLSNCYIYSWGILYILASDAASYVWDSAIKADARLASLHLKSFKLYLRPVALSIFLFLSLLIDSDSSWSNRMTWDGLICIALNKLTWASVYGKPSSTQPFTWQSLCFNLCSTKVLMILSGTMLPVLMWLLITLESSGHSSIFF